MRQCASLAQPATVLLSADQPSISSRAVNEHSRISKCLEKASTRDFSLLKAHSPASKIKNLLRHYAKWAFKHCIVIVDVKLGCLSSKIIINEPFGWQRALIVQALVSSFNKEKALA